MIGMGNVRTHWRKTIWYGNDPAFCIGNEECGHLRFAKAPWAKKSNFLKKKKIVEICDLLF